MSVEAGKCSDDTAGPRRRLTPSRTKSRNRSPICRGTESSSPLPSSGESTNHRFLGRFVFGQSRHRPGTLRRTWARRNRSGLSPVAASLARRLRRHRLSRQRLSRKRRAAGAVADEPRLRFSTPGIRRFCLCERDALGGRYGVAPKVVKSQEMTVEASSSDPGRRSPAVRLGSDRACANSSALRTSGGATVRGAIKGL